MEEASRAVLIQLINEALEKCQDTSLLDLIFSLLVNSCL